jgi:hypothetical protein
MTNDSYDIIREYWTLMDDLLYPFDDTKSKDFPNEYDSIVEKRRRLAAIPSKLQTLTVGDLGQCKKNLLSAIDKVLEIIEASKLGYPLARNQGLIIDNYVYGKLLSVVEGAVKSPLGLGYPNFYYERGGDFDSQPLVILLLSFKAELESKEFPNYPAFADFFREFKKQVLEMWEKENRTHRRKR